MKFKNALVLMSSALISLSTNSFAKPENKMNDYKHVTESTMIALDAKSVPQLTSLLIKGAEIVKQTEPNTKSWFALKEGEDKFYIFDVFPDEQGRAQHFNGKVANALKESANKLVINGWKEGVVNNINNSQVLSAKLPKAGVKMTVANYITFKAKPGCEEDIAALLTGAAELVDKIEPNTTAWFAIKLSRSEFAIFDAFINEKGQKEHFAGKVAAALHEKASTHIVNGWDKGVVANIKNLKVIAHK